MSRTNNHVRSLRDKFQQQRFRTEQKHDVSFSCSHCGEQQMITLIFPLTNQTKDSNSLNESFDSKNMSTERKSPVLLRQVSTISENEADDDNLNSPFNRTNYQLDIRHSTRDRRLSNEFQENIEGFVDNCLRSSLHQVATLQQNPNLSEIVEVEYDPILGNVKSTRKRSSTITTHLENPQNRLRPVRNRPEPIINRTERDPTPIWARRRTSHSTVKPSDLVREHDKREKLEATALRRLSRADLIDESAHISPKTSHPNPSVNKETILRWCQEVTQFYKGVHIRNFSSSWSDGLAFCAIVHRYFPDEFNFDTLNANERRQYFDLAFNVALIRAGIEPLIDTNDMLSMGNKPDSKVVFTYVQSLYRHLSRLQPPAVLRERW